MKRFEYLVKIVPFLGQDTPFPPPQHKTTPQALGALETERAGRSGGQKAHTPSLGSGALWFGMCCLVGRISKNLLSSVSAIGACD